MLWRRTDRNPRSRFTVSCKKYAEIYGRSVRIECLPGPLFSYCRVEFTWISSKFQGFRRAYACASNRRRPRFAFVEKSEAIVYITAFSSPIYADLAGRPTVNNWSLQRAGRRRLLFRFTASTRRRVSPRERFVFHKFSFCRLRFGRVGFRIRTE